MNRKYQMMLEREAVLEAEYCGMHPACISPEPPNFSVMLSVAVSQSCCD